MTIKSHDNDPQPDPGAASSRSGERMDLPLRRRSGLGALFLGLWLGTHAAACVPARTSVAPSAPSPGCNDPDTCSRECDSGVASACVALQALMPPPPPPPPRV